jgi:uncharacterized membrane protein YqiK
VSHALTVTLVTLIFVAAFTFWSLGRAAGAADAQDATTTTASELAIRAHDRTLAWRQKLQTIQRTHEQKLDSARKSVAVAWQRAQAPAGPSTEGDSLWRTVAFAERVRGNECQAALNACTLRADRAEADAQNLREQLGRQVAMRGCTVRLALFTVGCPSRSTMFFGGAGVGVAVTVLLTTLGR